MKYVHLLLIMKSTTTTAKWNFTKFEVKTSETQQQEVKLTGIRSGKNSSLSKIAVEVVATVSLVVCIHGIRRMRSQRIWVKAGSTILYWFTVHPRATNKIYVSLQRLITNIHFRHAPHSPRYWRGCCWRWHCRCRTTTL